MDIDNISLLLKEYRQNNNLTQENLASKLFVSRKTISKWENKRGLPDIIMMNEIAQLMDISLDELLGRVPRENIIVDKDNIELMDRKRRFMFGAIIMIIVYTIINILSLIPYALNTNLVLVSELLYAFNIVSLITTYSMLYIYNILPSKRKSENIYYMLLDNLHKQVLTVVLINILLSVLSIILLALHNSVAYTTVMILHSLANAIWLIYFAIKNYKEIK